MKKIVIFFLFVPLYVISFLKNSESTKTIALIPSGIKTLDDRAIGDFYQYGITQQMCQKISDELIGIFKRQDRRINIVILRPKMRNEKPFAQAEYVNKCAPDVVIHIGVYMQPKTVAHIDVYSYKTLPLGQECLAHEHQGTHLVTADHAHCKNSPQSAGYGQKFSDFFKNDEHKGSYVTQILHIPFGSLKGIVYPAFAFELGITQPSDWTEHIHNIAQAIIHTIGEKEEE